MKVIGITAKISAEAWHSIIETRLGEKIHQQKLVVGDTPHAYEFNDYCQTLLTIGKWGHNRERTGDGQVVNRELAYSS